MPHNDSTLALAHHRSAVTAVEVLISYLSPLYALPSVETRQPIVMLIATCVSALAFSCDWLQEERYGVHLLELQGHLQGIEGKGTLVPVVEPTHALRSSSIIVHQYL